MVVAAIVIGVVLVVALLFAIAELVFGPAGAVALTSAVGFCFGGPPGAGIGIVVGLVLLPVVYGLGLLAATCRPLS